MADPLTYDPLNDYRLILDLPTPIRQKVAEVKIEFDQSYKGLVIAAGPPLIYLASFALRESREAALVAALDQVALTSMPFKMQLKHFGHIQADEIFIAVADEAPLKRLREPLSVALEGTGELHINSLPRVTLARRLQPFQFAQSWRRYEKKSFSATFVVDEMLLLKRMEGYRSWQILKRLQFQNLLIRNY